MYCLLSWALHLWWISSSSFKGWHLLCWLVPLTIFWACSFNSLNYVYWLFMSFTAYHAGLNNKLRSSVLDKWILSKIHVVVATVAFGYILLFLACTLFFLICPFHIFETNIFAKFCILFIPCGLEDLTFTIIWHCFRMVNI